MPELLFSQSSVHVCCKIFPRQADYFEIKQDTLIILSARHVENSDSRGEKELRIRFTGQLLQVGKFSMLYTDALEACSAVSGVLIL